MELFDLSRGTIRPRIADMAPQQISAVSKLGMGRSDITPLWFGESDLHTPEFIKDAAEAALAEGHTFYLHPRGLEPLRTELAGYTNTHFDAGIDASRVTVTGSAMTAIMIALQTIIDPGDSIVIPAPIWPNILFAADVLGADTNFVPLEATEAGWSLDLGRLFDACDARTKAIFLASPGNPTGWLMPESQMVEVMEFARRRNIWIIADEAYHRLALDRPEGRATSFLALSEPDDLLLSINSFSKTWAMTGWRLGWITGPNWLGDTFGQLSGLNNTGATSFVQHAGIAAVQHGEDFAEQMRVYCAAGRDIATVRLNDMERVTLPPVEAGLFAHFKIDGVTDSLSFAKRLLIEHGIGLAPGTGFGPGGEGYFRACFAVAEDKLHTAFDKLKTALADN